MDLCRLDVSHLALIRGLITQKEDGNMRGADKLLLWETGDAENNC